MNIQSLNSASSGSVIADKINDTALQAAVSPQNASPVLTAAAVTQAAKAPSIAEVNKAVDDINKTLKTLSQNLEFSIDTDAKSVVVKVVDLQTKEVLRQIPTVEALEIAKSLDRLQGLLIKNQA